MANTITQRNVAIKGADGKDLYRLISIVSDGTEETNLVIYDNSAFINIPSAGRLMQVWASGSDARLTLSWDQTTDSTIVALNPANSQYLDFRNFGGIPNPNEAGATGDLLLTTGVLDNNDVVSLLVHIYQGT